MTYSDRARAARRLVRRRNLAAFAVGAVLCLEAALALIGVGALIWAGVAR